MKKITKKAAGYKPAEEVKPGQKAHCGNCSMFQKPNGCTLVRGRIERGAWCKHWGRKGGK